MLFEFQVMLFEFQSARVGGFFMLFDFRFVLFDFRSMLFDTV